MTLTETANYDYGQFQFHTQCLMGEPLLLMAPSYFVEHTVCVHIEQQTSDELAFKYCHKQ